MEEKLDSGKAAELVKLPAIGLIFVGVFDLIVSLVFLLSGDYFEEMARHEFPDQDWSALAGSGAATVALTVVGLAIAVLVVVGGAQMLKVKSWGLALTAAILTMIPCFGPCCGLFLPLGIWALVVLLKPEVKQALR